MNKKEADEIVDGIAACFHHHCQRLAPEHLIEATETPWEDVSPNDKALLRRVIVETVAEIGSFKISKLDEYLNGGK